MSTTRAEVVEAWRKLARKVSNPNDLSLDDPEVIDAYTALDKFIAEAEARLNFEKTLIMLEAGFSDPEYLEEIADDWLFQDHANAEANGFDTLARDIKNKIDEIHGRL